jgi:hypothetical protein
LMSGLPHDAAAKECRRIVRLQLDGPIEILCCPLV